MAACLATLGEQDISKALCLYESLRLPRTSRTIQAASMENNLPDGPQQQERDAHMVVGAQVKVRNLYQAAQQLPNNEK